MDFATTKKKLKRDEKLEGKDREGQKRMGKDRCGGERCQKRERKNLKDKN